MKSRIASLVLFFTVVSAVPLFSQTDVNVNLDVAINTPETKVELQAAVAENPGFAKMTPEEKGQFLMDRFEKYPRLTAAACRWALLHPGKVKWIKNHPNAAKYLKDHPAVRDAIKDNKGERMERQGERREERGEKLQDKGEKLQEKGFEKAGEKLEKKGERMERQGERRQKKGGKLKD